MILPPCSVKQTVSLVMPQSKCWTIPKACTKRNCLPIPERIADFFPDVLCKISDKDVSDNHAIIPTMELEKADISALPVGERNVFLLICCKLLYADAEPDVYETVVATFDCRGHIFKAKSKWVLSEGWKKIKNIFRVSLKSKQEDEDTGNGAVISFEKRQTFAGASAKVTEHFTVLLKAYTEDTLLAAMERVGAEKMPENSERKGLGTPATRAGIIEKLVSGGFVECKGKSLVPTKNGIYPVAVLPEMLTSPMLTAEWG